MGGDRSKDAEAFLAPLLNVSLGVRNNRYTAGARGEPLSR